MVAFDGMKCDNYSKQHQMDMPPTKASWSRQTGVDLTPTYQRRFRTLNKDYIDASTWILIAIISRSTLVLSELMLALRIACYGTPYLHMYLPLCVNYSSL